ncbi:MAG: NUDIX hydrolase [Anaerolineae bacterium]
MRQLERALDGELPGVAAQVQMASHPGRSLPSPSDRPRQSAVLALLHRASRELELVFTLRPPSLRHHGGQISFPGGGMEPQDATLKATALRETAEELGISTQQVEILGELSPLFIAHSDNLVHPFVGWVPDLPPLNPDPVEVSSVISIPVRVLLDPQTVDVYRWRRNGQMLTAPCYRVNGTSIWGATAMILNELLELIRGLGRQDQRPSSTSRPVRS